MSLSLAERKTSETEREITRISKLSNEKHAAYMGRSMTIIGRRFWDNKRASSLSQCQDGVLGAHCRS